MEPNEIRAELLKKNIQVTEIARQLGVTHPNVSVVISGKRPNPKVRKAIAKAINKSVAEIWPEEAGREERK